MKKLLADYFPNNKERQDFFIALVVIALFIIGILTYILPKRTALPTTPLTAEELTQKVADLEGQRLAFDKHIVTDIEGYRPYYDHQQATVIHDANQAETKEVATASAAIMPAKEEVTKEIDVLEPSPEVLESEEEITENETSIIIESEEAPISEEALEKAILEEVPPNLNEDGSIVESEVEVTTSDEVEREEAVESYDIESNAEAIQAERERERLAAAEAKAKAERARQAQLAKERAARKKRQAANTLQGCHVIVGAFKDTKNARSFREQVKKEKFKVAVGSVRGKTYVGIPVKCNNEAEIKAIQERVNATFGIKSWTLRN